MMPYQSQAIAVFLKMLPSGCTRILEIGSDIGGEVLSTLAIKTKALVVGLNPATDFPDLVEPTRSFPIRGDGRFLPFSDGSFDAVLSIATMEHVNGIELLLAEITRVLKPKGLFYTTFEPIWSSGQGHHVYARVREKEARFWKPGKNPLPDYAHLLMTPEEMRAYLRSGPCCEELIEPIIHWVYFGDSINRCYFEEYMRAFHATPLVIQYMRLFNREVEPQILVELRSKYHPDHNFSCTSISTAFRKLPRPNIGSSMFACSVRLRRRLEELPTQLFEDNLLVKALRRLKRRILTP